MAKPFIAIIVLFAASASFSIESSIAEDRLKLNLRYVLDGSPEMETAENLDPNKLCVAYASALKRSNASNSLAIDMKHNDASVKLNEERLATLSTQVKEMSKGEFETTSQFETRRSKLATRIRDVKSDLDASRSAISSSDRDKLSAQLSKVSIPVIINLIIETTVYDADKRSLTCTVSELHAEHGIAYRQVGTDGTGYAARPLWVDSAVCLTYHSKPIQRVIFSGIASVTDAKKLKRSLGSHGKGEYQFASRKAWKDAPGLVLVGKATAIKETQTTTALFPPSKTNRFRFHIDIVDVENILVPDFGVLGDIAIEVFAR